jgi:tryptophan synthase alpha chain
MNRIDKKFAELKEQNKKALITFITSGDAGYETTENAVLAMEKAGADIVELGVPFSDPIAEGPVIQAASDRAIKGGTTLKGLFEMVKRIRKKTDMPLVFMMYLNTIYKFGTAKFFDLCEECGIDGVIVPDMPYEEKDEIQSFADAKNIHNISLIAPTSKDRIGMIAKDATGFVYCVSSTGVTGMRSEFSTDFDDFMGHIKENAKVPCAIGFGISSPEAAKKMSAYADGVIVGSAIVKIVAEKGKDAPDAIYDFVKSLRDGIDN